MAPTMRRMAHLGAEPLNQDRTTAISAPKTMKGPPHQPRQPPKMQNDCSRNTETRTSAHRPNTSYKDSPKLTPRSMRTQIAASRPTLSTMMHAAHHTTAIPTPHSKISPDVLPEIPAWLAYIFGMLLLSGFLMSILLCFVNFPPECFWVKKPKSRRAYAYRQLEQHGLRGHRYDEERPRPNEPSFAGSGYQAKTMPGPGSATPQELHFRIKNKRRLTVDTKSTYIGLGLTVPEIRTSPSAPGTPWTGSPAVDEPRDVAVASWRPLTRPLHSSQSLLNSTIGWEHRDGVPEDGHEHNLESGLASRSGSASLRPTPSPSLTASSSSSSLSQARILAMLGDGVERFADCLTKMLDDHVKNGDAEGGLLLPVQDCEREEWPPLEMSQLNHAKKTC